MEVRTAGEGRHCRCAGNADLLAAVPAGVGDDGLAAGGDGKSARLIRAARRFAQRRRHAIAQAPAAAALLPEVGFGIESLDKAMRRTLKEYGIPGGALAVAVGGKLVVAKGYGWANVAARQPVTVNSLFCLASVSKAVTARGRAPPGARRQAVAGRPRLSALGQPAAAGGLSTRRADQADHGAAIAAARRRLRSPARAATTCTWRKKIAKQTGHKLPLPDELAHSLRLQPAAGLRPRARKSTTRISASSFAAK